jgi:hypothetical protein
LNSKFSSLFLDSSDQKILINDEKIEIKKSVDKDLNLMNNIKINNDEINDEKNLGKGNKRLHEYNQIFKLLNENIEQFKNILNTKDINADNKTFKRNKLNKLSLRENYKTLNGNSKNEKKLKNSGRRFTFYDTKNKKHGRRNKTIKQRDSSDYKRIFNKEIKVNNPLVYSHNFSREKKSEIYSFMESFTEDDLFMPLDFKHHRKSSKSLTNIFSQDKKEENSKKINKKELEKISTYDMSSNNNKCTYNDDDIQIETFGPDEQINMDIKNRVINPHFFSNDSVNKKTNNEKMRGNKNKDCYIF